MLTQSPCDRDALTDIRLVQVDGEAPIALRAKRYMDQIKDPYCFLVGDTLVRLQFTEGGPSLEEAVKRYLKGLA